MQIVPRVLIDPSVLSDLADALAGGGGSNTTIPSTSGDGVTDNTAAINAAVSPTGTFFAAGKTVAQFPIGGVYKAGLIDLHPSVSLEMGARGGKLLTPIDNLPALNADGAQASVIRFVRDTPSSSSNLAWAPTLSGFNIDFRGTTQVNACAALRTPNPNPANNIFDPDFDYAGNKDYVAGRLVNCDFIGGPGDGWVVEGGNGRADVLSSRMLNFAFNGYVFGGNDVVMGGHWAVGGCGTSGDGFGLKVGDAAGFFAVTGNLWGSSAKRSLTCGAAWFNQRKMFALGYSEFNDWLRMDGGHSYWRGGSISNNVMAPFSSNFVSDGVAIDLTPNDSRLQANGGITEYQSLALWGNIHCRTDKAAPMATPSNIGGDLTGIFGTAPQCLWDVSGAGSQPAMVNIMEPYCTAPNVKPWSGTKANFTVTIASPGVFTSAAHGMQNGYRVGFSTTGALPTGIVAGTTPYYVIVIDANTFQVAATYGGAAIVTTGSQSGTHTFYNLSTSPYNVHNGGQVNYAYQDAYTCLFRVGALGPVHSHIALGIAEIDDINPNYAIEIGDRTQPSFVPWRNAAYGMWEFANAVQYTDAAFDSRVITNGQTRVVKAGQTVQRLSVAGGGIAGATIQLPTDLNASQYLDVFITGGPIAALTWTVAGAGTINANTPPLPTYTQGFTQVRGWYERGTNSWYNLQLVAGDRSGALGRVDGNGAQAGIVGEVLQSTVIQGSAVALTTATPADVTSKALTAGNYRISWSVKIRGSAATVTQVTAGVNTTAATLAVTKADQCSEETVAFTTQTGNLKTLSGGSYLLNLNAPATVYLSAQATFSAGTMSAFGALTIERVS